MHVTTLRSGFKAAEGGGPPSRFRGINAIGGEAAQLLTLKLAACAVETSTLVPRPKNLCRTSTFGDDADKPSRKRGQ